VADLTEQVRGLRATLSRVQGRRDACVRRLADAEKEVLRLVGEEDVLDRVCNLFRVLIDREVVDNAQTAERLLSEGLRTIFDDLNLSVRTEVDVQRGKVSVDLYTVQTQPNGVTTEAASTDAFGGSVSVIQSILLRVVVVMRRGLRPLLLLDESLAAVAEQYVPRVGLFLSELATRMGLDILVVTHNTTLVEAADKAYRIRKDTGEAIFTEVRV
jgi:DNA repair exonuclease SbcCD ATPase subunit